MGEVSFDAEFGVRHVDMDIYTSLGDFPFFLEGRCAVTLSVSNTMTPKSCFNKKLAPS